MLAVVAWGAWLRFARPPFAIACVPVRLQLRWRRAGFIAVVAGWTVTEVGRQPWVVYGLLRTRDAVSPSITGTDVANLAAVLCRRVCRNLQRGSCITSSRIARVGPPTELEAHDARLHERPARPLSAADA